MVEEVKKEWDEEGVAEEEWENGGGDYGGGVGNGGGGGGGGRGEEWSRTMEEFEEVVEEDLTKMDRWG